ncbi:MAG: 50S ribosomal protein L19e [Candidatus Micrarchaeaceae archaeon]
MTIKLAKRLASQILGRGESSIRIKDSALEDAKKAITHDDVRRLVQNGSIFAVKAKKNLSMSGRIRKARRKLGRSRGPGRKRGSAKARSSIGHMRRMRSQRRILRELKSSNYIDNQMYKRFYALVKGGTFQTKATLINHIISTGVKIDQEKIKSLKHI